MTKDKAIEILENEMKCVESSDTCGRDCLHCPLVREQSDVMEAYKFAIKALRRYKV